MFVAVFYMSFHRGTCTVAFQVVILRFDVAEVGMLAMGMLALLQRSL